MRRSSADRPFMMKCPGLGRLITGQAGKVTQLDQASLDGIVLGQLIEGLVENQQVFRRFLGDDQVGVQVHLSAPRRRGPVVSAPRTLDQDASHGHGRGGEEVSATIPTRGILGTDQAEVRLMDQGRRLEGLSGFLVGESLCGQLAQLVVDQGSNCSEALGSPCLIAERMRETSFIGGPPPVLLGVAATSLRPPLCSLCP